MPSLVLVASSQQCQSQVGESLDTAGDVRLCQRPGQIGIACHQGVEDGAMLLLDGSGIGDAVSLGGFVSVTLLIVVLLFSRAAVRWLLADSSAVS